jgi:biopolymer transport protein ExbB
MNFVSVTGAFALATLLTAAPLFSKDDPDATKRKALEDVKRELASLENLKAEKLEALEKKEAERWDARYRQAAHAKEADEKARSLEEKYGRLATDMTRLEEELVKARNETKDKDDEAAAAKQGWDGFNATLKRAVDGAAENLATDIPLGVEDRTLRLSRAGDLLADKGAGKSADTKAADKSADAKTSDFSATDGALRDFIGVTLSRLDLTLRQSVESRQAVFGEGRPAEAWRLQLGTVFIGELEKGGKGESQILLRTGNLQGRTFVWRSDLAEGYNKTLAKAVSEGAQGQSPIVLPLDVLQYKSVGSGFVKGEEQTLTSRVTGWFKAGGVTLYPLFAVGILSLLMILERLVYFARKNVNARAFMKRFMDLADQRKWQEARELCRRSGSALARVLGAIAEHADQSRDAAEKAVREAMLREVPALEKRLPLIAAMGAAAPLLGLLGTVSGLVTLFKVLNQLGANDPKVLAGGISEALINTETGLAIAIPVLLMHGFLNEKLDTINAKLGSGSLEVLNKLWPKG